MGIRRAVWLALTVPLFAILLIMLPMLAGGTPRMWKAEDLRVFLELSIGFGMPQYLVFAPLLAWATRGRTDAQIQRLALLAPLLFVPFLVAPMLPHALSVQDVAGMVGLMGGLSIVVGYPCVLVGLAVWASSTAKDADA